MPQNTPRPIVTSWETHDGETHGYDPDGNERITITAPIRASRWESSTNVRTWTVQDENNNCTATGYADGLRASKKAALAALAAS